MGQPKWLKMVRDETFTPGSRCSSAILLLARVQLAKDTSSLVATGGDIRISAETSASWPRSKQCSLALKLGEKTSRLENGVYCSLFNQQTKQKILGLYGRSSDLLKLWITKPWLLFKTCFQLCCVLQSSSSNQCARCVSHKSVLYVSTYKEKIKLQTKQKKKTGTERAADKLSHGCHLLQGGTDRHFGQKLAYGNTETVRRTLKVVICINTEEAVKSCYILTFFGSEKILRVPLTKCNCRFAYELIRDWLGSRQTEEEIQEGREWSWLRSPSVKQHNQFRLILSASEKHQCNSNVSETHRYELPPYVTHTQSNFVGTPRPRPGQEYVPIPASC